MKTNKTIEAAIALSQMETVEIEKIGATTGVKLKLDPARSNKNFRVFRGCCEEQNCDDQRQPLRRISCEIHLG